MRTMRLRRSLSLCFILSTMLAGCATTGQQAGESAEPSSSSQPVGVYDPFEPFNRAMYRFNDVLDRYLLKPVAKGYRFVLPSPVRTGVSNFFSNLHDPAVAVNGALQGKFKQAASDVGRFLVNSTLGVYGLFDVATFFGIERHNEDFGQTLGMWGVGDGPYLVLPLFGPSNIRDGVGLYADFQMYPPTYVDDRGTRNTLYAVEIIDVRARLLDAGDILDQAAGQDPYVFVREAYGQRRRSLINDGAESAPAPLDPSIFEDQEPGPKPPAPEPVDSDRPAAPGAAPGS